MAGTIFLLDDRDWGNGSSVFYWVIDTIAERSRDAGLSARLREISDNNLGILDLAELSAPELREFVELAREAPRFAREELSDSPHRDAFVAHIVEFSASIASDRGRPATTQG